MPKSYDPAKDGAEMSFDGGMSYGDYLCLEPYHPSKNPNLP